MAKKNIKKYLKAKRAIEHLYREPSIKQTVKGEFVYNPKKNPFVPKKNKNAEIEARTDDSSAVKRNIVKSLLLASFILSLELVLYFVWK